MRTDIPFNMPAIMGREMTYMEEAVRSGHSSSGGPFTQRAREILSDWHSASEVLLTTSCTDALEMSAMLMGVGPGDVVVVPSFTFTSTALAFARQGATLRFCDIDPLTLGLDPAEVAAVMDDRVVAIVAVNYAGIPCALSELAQIALDAGVALIEDNAHGLLGSWHGKQLGTFGRMSTLSFHETKNFICGEGGALVLNDPADVQAAHVLLDKGTNRQQFIDGQVDKYTWQGLGSSFGLSDLLAAFLVGQLEQADAIQSARRGLSSTYRELLEPHVEAAGLQLPIEIEGADSADHMFYVLLPREADRGEVISRMRENGVNPTFHYVPLHSSPAGRRFVDVYRDCPVTDDISSRLLRLPFFNELRAEEQERVVQTLLDAVTTS